MVPIRVGTVYGLFQRGLWWNSGRDMDVPVHVVSVRGSDENILFSGFSK